MTKYLDIEITDLEKRLKEAKRERTDRILAKLDACSWMKAFCNPRSGGTLVDAYLMMGCGKPEIVIDVTEAECGWLVFDDEELYRCFTSIVLELLHWDRTECDRVRIMLTMPGDKIVRKGN